MTNPLVELVYGTDKIHPFVSVRRGWLYGMPIGGVSFIGPLKTNQLVAVAAPRILSMSSFPDKDDILGYDSFVRKEIMRDQPKGSNAFMRGDTISRPTGDGPSEGDMDSEFHQAIQFYNVDPNILTRMIKTYGKRVDFKQKKYANNPNAVYSL